MQQELADWSTPRCRVGSLSPSGFSILVSEVGTISLRGAAGASRGPRGEAPVPSPRGLALALKRSGAYARPPR